jgi:hypothetical protein
MMIHTRLLAITLASLAFAGCSDSDTLTGTIPPTPTTLNGTWLRSGEVPGSSEQWALTMTDTLLVASGTWTGEACCSGTIVGAGHVSGDSLHVDLNFFDDSASTTGTPRFTEHVDAVQATIDDILGTVRRDSATVTLHLHRVQPD